MMKKYRFALLTVFVAMFAIPALRAQSNCYVRLTDASGYTPAAEQIAALEQAAAALCLAFDSSGFSGQFKVYDFGFYLHHETTTGGYPEPFARKVEEVAALSPYYLLFGKQSDPTGLYTRIYVDLKIPNTGFFTCVDSTKLKIIKETIQVAVNEEYARIGNLHFMYSDAEIKGMNVLSKIFASLRSGNCCVPSDEAVESWLTAKGFVKLDIENTNYNNPKVLGPISARPDPIQKRSNDYVTDFANLLVQVENKSLNLKDGVNEVLESNYSGNNPKFFILKNQSICNGEFETAITELSQNLPNIGGIFYIQNKLVGPDNLYVKVMGMTSSEIPNFVADLGEYEAPPPCGATDFQDLVNTIRQAEDSLISHGYTKIKDRIKILRGIYYGTDWSMDRAQDYGTTTRNNGFKLYLCDAFDPVKPDTIFGNALYNKLKCSPEVKNENLGVDWGHIIIGLEARLSWCSRENEVLIPPHKTSGLEITTWIGDIGGGAGMLAFRRVTDPSKRAIDMFNDKNDFGGWFNMEGDIAAYLVGRNTSSFDHTPSVNITDNQYIADAVQSYLLPQPSPPNSEFNKRGRLFLSMLGGTVDEQGNLTNEPDLLNHLVPKVQDFAEYYLVNMSLSRPVNFQEVSRHLGGASREITSLFINCLKTCGYNPNSRAHPQNYNPPPTPPGEPYENIKFTSRQVAEDIKRQIEEWINRQ